MKFSECFQIETGAQPQHTMGKWFNILGEQNISNLWPRISRKSGHRPTTEHEIASSFGTDAVNVFICWLAPTKRHYLQPDCCHNFTDKVCFTMAEVPRWSCFVSGIELSVWLFVPCPRADRFRFYVWWIMLEMLVFTIWNGIFYLHLYRKLTLKTALNLCKLWR